jgi:hypothetical protein
MSRNVCEEVFGKSYKDLTPEELVLFRRYNRKVSYYHQHEKNKIHQRNKKQRRKLDIIHALGLKPQCQRQHCLYSRCIAALDFHHKSREEKDFNILDSGSFEEQLEESKKCELLCSNCHRETHFIEGDSAKQGRPKKEDPLLDKFIAAYNKNPRYLTS